MREYAELDDDGEHKGELTLGRHKTAFGQRTNTHGPKTEDDRYFDGELRKAFGKLTPKEIELYDFLAKQKTVRQAAIRFGISEQAVRQRWGSVRRKLV